MPESSIRFYKTDDNSIPVYEWLSDLKRKDRIGYARVVAKIKVLAMLGLDARRPAVEYLRDGIYELRAKKDTVQYRILFFYQERNIVILTHHLIKKGSKVPDYDIDLAVGRKERFIAESERHTYEQEEGF